MTPGRFVRLNARVVTGRNFLAAKTDRQLIERSKLQTAVAGDTRNGRLAVQVTVDEGLDHVALEFLLEIQNVKRKSKFFGDATRIVNIIERTATRRQRLAVFIHTDTATLVPQLHREADEVVPLLSQNCGG